MFFKIFIVKGKMKDFIKSKLTKALNLVDESNIVTIDKVSPNADEITQTVVYPIVKNLYRGINKLKKGEYENLTKEEKAAIIKVFPSMINRKTKEFRKDYSLSDGYLRPLDFVKIYSVKTLDGKKKKVSVGFYYDKKTNDIAYFEQGNNGIAINIAKVNINNLNQLQSTIRHELIHSADPKVVNKKLRKTIDTNKTDDDYHKLPYEFDSFTHEFVTTIDKNLNLIEDGETKDALLKNLWILINHLKNGFSANVLFNEFGDNAVIRLFSEGGVSSKNIRGLRHNFFQFLIAANKWATKPTLFQRFVKRLVRYAPYKV